MKNLIAGIAIFFTTAGSAFSAQKSFRGFIPAHYLVSHCQQVYATSAGASPSDFQGFRLELTREKSERGADSYLKGAGSDFSSEAVVSLTKRQKNLTLLAMGDDDEMYWSRRSDTPGDAFPGYYLIEQISASRANIEIFFLPYGEYDSDEMPRSRKAMLETLQSKSRFLASLKNCTLNKKLLRSIRGSKFD